MSLLQQQLDLFERSDNHAATIDESSVVHPIVRSLLQERGISSAEEIARFIKPDYERDTHDPFLFDDMHACVDRIVHAIETDEKICIYGDYDVDGVCSAVILHDTLTKLGAHVMVKINHRDDEGYGIHTHAIDDLADKGISLIITTDQGISNKLELDHAGALGIDVIITDHHTVPDDESRIPIVVGIIHPRVHADRYPFKDLSGGGAAFKLAQALIRTMHQEPDTAEREEKWLLDLVCISTLADCVPLRGENRVFLHYGLIVLNKTRRIGLQALISTIPVPTHSITPHSISFYLSPLLNAASRMDHAQRSFDLLTAETYDDAERISEMLAALNKERQKLTVRVTREAHAQCKVQGNEQSVLVGASDTWPLGVLGLVAGTLVRTFKKPVVLISKKPNKNVGVARSTADIHITHAFQKIDSLFDRFGGHHRAGGFALKSDVTIEDFTEHINTLVHEPIPLTHSDDNGSESIPLRLGDVTNEFSDQLSLCQPWGQGNPRPLFSISECVVKNISCVGKKQQHLRLVLEQHATQRIMLGIRKAKRFDDISLGDVLTVQCTVDVGQWNGQKDMFIELIHYQKETA